MKNSIKYILIASVLLVIHSTMLSSQEIDENKDIITAGSDSLGVKSDTLETEYSEYTEPDSLLYTAKNASYDKENNTMWLSGNAHITYKDITVDADSLYLDMDKKIAYSSGDAMIKQDGQIFLSNDVKIDIDSENGLMEYGSGSIENGFLYGKQIRKVADKVYDIDDGKFTTCDDVDPHFYIKGKKLRVYFGDKIAGKPFVYYVNHFPVMAFPFATFTIKKGRHSGVLIPQPGWNSSDGKYIKNIAYYYAYKDYFDSKVAFDFYEKKGWNFSINNRYIQRYLFNGNLNFLVRRRDYANSASQLDWSIIGNHRQTFEDQSKLTAKIDYATSKKLYESSTDIDERLRERMSSNVSYSKQFDNSSLNISSVYSQNFVTDTKTITLPSLSYSQSPKPIYEMLGYSSKESKDLWWKSLSLNYGFTASHYGSVTEEDSEFSDIIWDNTSETDSLGNVTEINKHYAGAKHSLSLSLSPKVSDYFNISQSLSYTESWFDRTKEDNGFARGFSYYSSSSINTNLNGIRKINLGNIKAIRHVLTPKVSFTYAPDFTSNDKFYSWSNVGVSSSKRRRSINFSLNQKWQVKYFDTTSKQDKKLNNLISFNSSASYDLEKDTKKLSKLKHTLSFNPPGFNIGDVSVSYNNSFSFSNDFYDREWLDLNFRDWSMRQSVSLSGNASFFDYFPRPKNPLKTGQRVIQDTLKYAKLDYDYYKSNSEVRDWSLSLSNSASFEKDIFHVRSNNLNVTANFNLTKNWSVTYNSGLDILDGEILSQSLGLVRNLHCWTLTFDYTKSNEYWEYKVVLSNNKLSDIMKFPLEGRK